MHALGQRYAAWMDRNVGCYGITPVQMMVVSAFGLGFSVAWELCMLGWLPVK